MQQRWNDAEIGNWKYWEKTLHNRNFDPGSNLFLGLERMTPETWHGFNPLKPTGYVMHQQFNIQQLYALPTLYLCVLYLSENKQRIVPLTA